MATRSRGGWRIGLVCLLAWTGLLPACAAVTSPFAADRLAVSTLPNGLRLVVREDHSLPIVAMVVTVRGGSGVEMQAPGALHLLEHWTMLGTAHYPDHLAPSFAFEAVGGLNNAVTSRDMIRFEATAPSAQADLLVALQADIALAPTLTDAGFDQQRPVVLAEIQRESDQPLVFALNRAYWLTYPNHPYRFSPMGSVESVLRLTAEEVRARYRRWFLPNNMSVVLVGDITPARATELVTAFFGRAKAGPAPTWPTAVAARPESLARAHFNRDTPATTQVMAFPAPGSDDPAGQAATDLLMSLLADGPTARLAAAWAARDLQAADFGIEFISARGPGRFLIWAESSPASALALRAETQAVLHQLATTPVPRAELAAAKRRLAQQFLRNNETYSQQASTLAYYEGLAQPSALSSYLDTVDALTPEQVRLAAASDLIAWVTLGARPEGE